MKIVIAPDSFKGSLTSIEATHIISSAFESILPNCEIVKIPISDGGEGFVDAIHYSIGGEIHDAFVSGPLQVLPLLQRPEDFLCQFHIFL